MKIGTVPEKVVERRIIVYKTRFDPTVIKLTAKNMKSEPFSKFAFRKPKPEEIRIISMDKYYEPYIVVDGKYTIDYYRKRVYTIEVEETMREIVILDKTFKPEPLEESRRVIKLEGEGRFYHEGKAYVILDKEGREVGPEQLPYAPSEEHPEEILKKFGDAKAPPQKEIDILRSRILKRPLDVERVREELFAVTERSVIYVPIYRVRFRNVKTGEEAVVRIDGVTGKAVS